MMARSDVHTQRERSNARIVKAIEELEQRANEKGKKEERMEARVEMNLPRRR